MTLKKDMPSLRRLDTGRRNEAYNYRRGMSSRIVYDDQFGDLQTGISNSDAAPYPGAGVSACLVLALDEWQGRVSCAAEAREFETRAGQLAERERTTAAHITPAISFICLRRHSLPTVPTTTHITCTQPLRVLQDAGLDGGSDEAHTPGAMGYSHTSATQPPDTLPQRSPDRTEEYFG